MNENGNGDMLVLGTQRLKKLRLNRGLTLDEAAAALSARSGLHVTGQQIVYWEREPELSPDGSWRYGIGSLSGRKLLAVCEYFETSADYLLGRTGEGKIYKVVMTEAQVAKAMGYPVKIVKE